MHRRQRLFLLGVRYFAYYNPGLQISSNLRESAKRLPRVFAFLHLHFVVGKKLGRTFLGDRVSKATRKNVSVIAYSRQREKTRGERFSVIAYPRQLEKKTRGELFSVIAYPRQLEKKPGRTFLAYPRQLEKNPGRTFLAYPRQREKTRGERFSVIAYSRQREKSNQRFWVCMHLGPFKTTVSTNGKGKKLTK